MRKFALAVVLLAACGSGDEDGATPTTSEETTGTEAVEQTATTEADDPVASSVALWYSTDPVAVVNACFSLDIAQQNVDLGDSAQDAFTAWLLDYDVPGNVASTIDNSSDARSQESMDALLAGCEEVT